MTINAIICVVRKPENFGFVADILESGTFEGVEVVKTKQAFVRVLVPDLDEVLADELKSKVKKFKAPSPDSNFYIELDSHGYTVASNSDLLEFIEDA